VTKTSVAQFPLRKTAHPLNCMHFYLNSQYQEEKSMRTHNGDDDARGRRIISREWLESRGERQRFSVEALCLHAFVESNVCEADSEPGHQTCDGGHVGEPTKYTTRSRRARHVSEQHEQRTENDGNVRKSTARCLQEDLWSIASCSKTICRQTS
jgi:hypothetical protein